MYSLFETYLLNELLDIIKVIMQHIKNKFEYNEFGLYQKIALKIPTEVMFTKMFKIKSSEI